MISYLHKRYQENEETKTDTSGQHSGLKKDEKIKDTQQNKRIKKH